MIHFILLCQTVMTLTGCDCVIIVRFFYCYDTDSFWLCETVMMLTGCDCVKLLWFGQDLTVRLLWHWRGVLQTTSCSWCTSCTVWPTFRPWQYLAAVSLRMNAKPGARRGWRSALCPFVLRVLVPHPLVQATVTEITVHYGSEGRAEVSEAWSC